MMLKSTMGFVIMLIVVGSMMMMMIMATDVYAHQHHEYGYYLTHPGKNCTDYPAVVYARVIDRHCFVLDHVCLDASWTWSDSGLSIQVIRPARDVPPSIIHCECGAMVRVPWYFGPARWIETEDEWHSVWKFYLEHDSIDPSIDNHELHHQWLLRVMNERPAIDILWTSSSST